MGYFEYTFRSKILGRNTKMAVFIPTLGGKNAKTLDECYPENIVFPTLYLMHGGGGDCSSWFHNTMVEVYAQEKGLMLVSADLQESFCSNTLYGYDFYDFFTEEVMLIAQRLFHSSPLRKDNFVAGFSMGGHCAMKVGLRSPEKFAACFGMSGAKDIVKMQKLAADMGISTLVKERYTFGPIDEIYGSENDLLHLAKSLAESDRPKPMIYTSCGLEDYGITLCREFKEHLDSVGLKNEFFSFCKSYHLSVEIIVFYNSVSRR